MSRRDLDNMLDKLIAKVAGLLVGRGFKRRGRVLKKVVDGNAAIVQFQRSVNSSARQIIFTINLGIVCGVLLDPERVDISTSGIPDAHLSIRLGRLLEVPSDKWWTLSDTTDLDSLTQKLSDAILARAIPYLERYLSAEALIALWESGVSPGLTAGQCSRFLSELKDIQKG
jgi:hypothetical protein